MKLHKKILFSIISVALFFGCMELVSRAFVFPGSYDYIERRIIEHKLAQHKRPGEFRIFLYGESTMHGGALYPYSVIGRWVRLYLADLLPEDVMRNITVVNFGMMGSNSTFIANSFAETIAYRPDLAVFYTVHNDFCLVEHRTALFQKKSFLHTLEDFFGRLPKRSAFLNLINRAVIKAKIERSKIADKKMSKEDSWYMESDAPEAFREDANLLVPGSLKFSRVTANFDNNVSGIIESAYRHKIPIIFFEGLSRWEGYEPVRSIHGETLVGDKLSEWERSFSGAEDLFAGDEYDKALTLYLKCIDMDKKYALSFYKAAECYRLLGERENANIYYSLANDHDYFPIRAPSHVNRLYESIRVSGIRDVYVIQTQKLIEENSPGGIVGESLTIDQIHPSPEGQALMALEIVKIIYENELLAPRDKWRWDKLRSIDELKKMLDLDRENMFYVYTGTASYMAKHYHEAAKALERALTIRPKSVFVRSWLAWTYWKMGEIDKSISLYRELSQEKPSSAEAFFKRQPHIKELLGDERLSNQRVP